MKKDHPTVPDDVILNKIFMLRHKKVMLDRDLASLYNVSTKVLNQSVKRHINRFPDDFMFQLTSKELEDWKSQTVTSNSIKYGLRKLPLAFTEQGVAMLSSVLNSEQAVEVNIRIIRLFSRMKEALMSHKDLLLKITQLEHKVCKNDDDINRIFDVLKKLIQVPALPRKKIGFRINKQE